MFMFLFCGTEIVSRFHAFFITFGPFSHRNVQQGFSPMMPLRFLSLLLSALLVTRVAVTRLLSAGNPEDEYTLIEFNDHAHRAPVCPALQICDVTLVG